MTRTFLDEVFTLICFITPVREVSSLLNSLVVSSSSTITISSPCFRRIRTAWGQGSSRMISSTLSSSIVAEGTTLGLSGRIAGPTTPSKVSGITVCSFGVESSSATDSTIVEGAVADSFIVVGIRSWLSSPLGAAIGSPACSRTLRDS